MAINWKEFQNELDQTIDEAGDRTNQKLAHKISSITRLTEVEVKHLFPVPRDVKRLGELIEIIKGGGDRKEKINMVVSNAESYSGIILTLLAKVV